MPAIRLLTLLTLLGALSLSPRPAHADDYGDCKGVNSLAPSAREVTADSSAVITAVWTVCVATAGDWVGLFVADGSIAPANWITYHATNGYAESSSSFVIPTGTTTGVYEFRYYAGKTNPALVARSPVFYVHGSDPTASGTLSHVWGSLGRGSYQTFTWTATPAHGQDHVIVYQYGGGAVQTCYTPGTAGGQIGCYLDGSLLSAGTYVACLYSGLTGTQLACDSTFSVT